MDTLSDMVSSSLFADKMIQREQGVVLEEISSYEDTPDDVVHEDFSRVVFDEHPLARPVLGTRETVSGFDHQRVHDYWASHYIPERALVVAAGRVDHDKLVKLVEKKLHLPTQGSGKPPRSEAPLSTQPNSTRAKEIVQAHFCLGGRGLSYAHVDRYAFFVLNTLLGAGMSSRLFQRIRERNGLAYSIYSFHESYSDTGLVGIYAGTEPRHQKRAEEMVRKELDKIMAKPLSKAELKRTKAQLKGGLTLGLENVSARMNRLARMELYLQRYHPLDDLLAGIDAVTAEDVQRVARQLFGGELSAAYVVPKS